MTTQTIIHTAGGEQVTARCNDLWNDGRTYAFSVRIGGSEVTIFGNANLMRRIAQEAWEVIAPVVGGVTHEIASGKEAEELLA